MGINLHRVSIVYSWFIRTITFFMPNYPAFMRFRGWLYSLMMKSCGKNFQVASDVIFNSLSGISVGRNVYIAPGNIFICTELYVGDEVIFGPNSVFSGGNHQFDGASFRRLPSKSKGSIRIGSGSWVAANCCVVTGGGLPERSVLAAGSVLNKEMLDDNSIYAGMPARKIGTVKCEAV